jgi:hypothetical protein
MLGFICQYKEFQELQIETFNDISKIGEQWDSILPPFHHLKSENLLVLQKNLNFECCYLLIHEKGKLQGLIYLQKAELSAKNIKIQEFKSFFGKISFKILFWLKPKFQLWVCGNLYRTAEAGYFLNSQNANLLQYLKHFLNNEKSSTTGLIIKESEKIQTQHLAFSFEPINDDLNMVMSIDPKWNTLEDYKLDLSKKYRKRLASIREKLIKIEKKELNTAEIENQKDRIYELYLNVLQKQKISLNGLKKEYFVDFFRQNINNISFVGYFEKQKLIGFAIYIFKSSEELELYYVGIDYKFNQEYNLYFNFLFDALETGINKKLKRILLGRTAKTAKANMGATSILQYNYFYISNPLVKWIVKRSLKNKIFLESEDWKNRNPFK